MNEVENNYQDTDLGNVSLNPKDEYDPTVAYEFLDTVSYQGGSYVCCAPYKTTITGTAPEPGKNTEFWQLLTLPGNLTAEAVAMHDDVVNKAAQVENSRAAVEQAQQEVEASQADVQQLHKDTVQAAQEAENSRDSAAGYAQSAEQSRKAASESEQNINAQMTGLNQKVSELVTQATGDIAAVRQQAIDTITTQEDASTEAVEQVGNAALESARQALRDINTAGQQAVQTVIDQQNTSAQAVKDETKNYIEEKKQEISAKTDEVTQAVNQAGKKQLQDIANSLDSTLSESGKAADSKAVGDALNTKITKFYASNQGETHLQDSDNGKIMGMMLYGKSEQATTNGYQLISAKTEAAEINGITFSCEYGKIILNGTAGENTVLVIPNAFATKEGKTYTISYTVLSNIKDVTVYGKTILLNRTHKTATATADGTESICIYPNDGAIFDKVELYVMIEEGATAHDWEPYTGGTPSPNPDYPQEIKSVVKPVYKVRGRNLVKSYQNNKTDKPYVNTLYAEIDEIMPDTQYVLSMIIADGNKAYINENLVKFTKVTGDGERKQIVVTTLSNISKTNARLYEKGKGWCILKNDTSNTVVSDVKDVQLELGSVATPYEPYREQVVTLPYTLNAIPVDSGGNVIIDGQRYVADYVDVERGKLVQRIDTIQLTKVELGNVDDSTDTFILNKNSLLVNKASGVILKLKCTHFCNDEKPWTSKVNYISWSGAASQQLRIKTDKDKEEILALLNSGDVYIDYVLAEPVETDLTPEEIQAFKQLATYYPVTNISVNSDQLDGYTVFNYPISMANGWNYVKQQLSDNRDYIYNMDTKTQDIDTQSAEAYVNSEYAVALTELEV